jgi:hypothetical protein
LFRGEFELPSSNGKPFFMIRLCSNEAAYEVKPMRSMRLDLHRLKGSYLNEIEVVFQTTPVAVLRVQSGVEVTITRSGKLIIRRVGDESEARKVAETVYSILQNLGSIQDLTR